jgi:hypothetical protein
MQQPADASVAFAPTYLNAQHEDDCRRVREVSFGLRLSGLEAQVTGQSGCGDRLECV